MNTFYLQSRTKAFDQQLGQTKVTDVYKCISDGSTPTMTGQTFGPTDAFDRSMSYEDKIATYTESYYEDFPTTPKVIVRGAVSGEPLETHPMFQSTDGGGTNGTYYIEQEEWTKYKKYQDDASSTTWTPASSTANFKKFWSYKEKGVDSYLAATIEAQFTKQESSAGDQSDIGTIQTNSNLPALPNDRNWLLVSIDSVKRGSKGKWENTYNYRASMANGWEKELYE